MISISQEELRIVGHFVALREQCKSGWLSVEKLDRTGCPSHHMELILHNAGCSLSHVPSTLCVEGCSPVQAVVHEEHHPLSQRVVEILQFYYLPSFCICI